MKYFEIPGFFVVLQNVKINYYFSVVAVDTEVTGAEAATRMPKHRLQPRVTDKTSNETRIAQKLLRFIRISKRQRCGIYTRMPPRETVVH